MRRRGLFSVAALAIVLAGALLIGPMVRKVRHVRAALALYDHQPPVLPSYESQRERFVDVQSQIVGSVDTLVLGDSISETNLLDGLCGKTFNAGIGGATIGDVQRLAPTFIARTRPKFIVLAIGTNDMIRGGGYAGRFRAAYRQLLHSLPIRPFALVGVNGADNSFIAAQAGSIGATFVPPVPLPMTWDKIHPTAAGALLWRDGIAAACPI